MPQIRKADCRICLDTDEVKRLISPCACKGSCKYVHSECLLKWYEQRPDRGLRCGSCLQPLYKKRKNDLEDIEFIDAQLRNYKIYSPITIITIYHPIFFTGAIALYPYYSEYPFAFYAFFQVIIHSIYIYGFWNLYSCVNNKPLYLHYWTRKSRLFLFVCHILSLLFMLKTQVLSGITADLCLYLYYLEHIDICLDINLRNRIVFLSRPRNWRRQLLHQ